MTERGKELDRLTPAELQVLRLLAAGHTQEEVAAITRTGVGTVKSHRNSAFHRLGLTGLSRPLARAAYLLGIHDALTGNVVPQAAVR